MIDASLLLQNICPICKYSLFPAKGRYYSEYDCHNCNLIITLYSTADQGWVIDTPQILINYFPQNSSQYFIELYKNNNLVLDLKLDPFFIDVSKLPDLISKFKRMALFK